MHVLPTVRLGDYVCTRHLTVTCRVYTSSKVQKFLISYSAPCILLTNLGQVTLLGFLCFTYGQSSPVEPVGILRFTDHRSPLVELVGFLCFANHYQSNWSEFFAPLIADRLQLNWSDSPVLPITDRHQLNWSDDSASPKTPVYLVERHRFTKRHQLRWSALLFHQLDHRRLLGARQKF